MDSPSTAYVEQSHQQPQLWIDDLPLDICVRIASIVKTVDYASALHLLPVSPAQCTAVKQAFSYRIDLDDSETNNSRDSIRAVRPSKVDGVAMLRNDAREIHVPGIRFYSPLFQPYFSIPSLTRLVIYGLNDGLGPDGSEPDLPVTSRNLHALELQITNTDRVVRLLTGLACPVLRELKLVTSERSCLHKVLTDDPENHGLLSTWFPNVEKLYLKCDRCLKCNQEPPSFLWRAIEKFSMLKDVTLTECVPEDATEKLRNLESVTVIGGSLFELVKKIPNRVAGVVTSRSWDEATPSRFTLDENRFDLFANCTGLQSLDCCIKRGTENLLAPIAKNLRSLGVSFELDAASDGRGREVLNPMKGALLNAVKQAPYLKSIRLANMRIERQELREILVVLGNQLEEFEETAITGSPIHSLLVGFMLYQPQTDRGKFEIRELITTLRTAALHNRSLRRVKIDAPHVLKTLRGSGSAFEIELERAMDLLQRRAPQLEMEKPDAMNQCPDILLQS